MNRRRFLQLGLNAMASGGALATLGGLERAMAASSFDTGGYRALVCLYLNGGNDAFNMLIPRSEAAYGQYASARRGLAVPREDILPITQQYSDGHQYGVHPSCEGLQQLFNSSAMSFVANVGSLVRPVTRDTYRDGSAELPLQLFSHEDQTVQWLTARSNSTERIGWAGRVADLMRSQGISPKLSVNVSLAGVNLWQQGGETVPYTLGLRGAPTLDVFRDQTNGGSEARTAAFQELLRQGMNSDSMMAALFSETQGRAIELNQLVNDGLNAAPPFETQFPSDHLGMQLKMAARAIRAREQLGATRQLFFISIIGFDTHAAQLKAHPPLLNSISRGLKAFYDATVEMGAQDLVTAFTTSDFGRTLTSNGDGTDHGWGAHQIVVGGGVHGKIIFGHMPNLAINGPDDAESGRIIPSQSIDQYSATLARWFGVSDSDLDLVFPNLGNFDRRSLGFLG
jgi:uncharacterized protein (DUF1501 family)